MPKIRGSFEDDARGLFANPHVLKDNVHREAQRHGGADEGWGQTHARIMPWGAVRESHGNTHTHPAAYREPFHGIHEPSRHAGLDQYDFMRHAPSATEASFYSSFFPSPPRFHFENKDMPLRPAWTPPEAHHSFSVNSRVPFDSHALPVPNISPGDWTLGSFPHAPIALTIAFPNIDVMQRVCGFLAKISEQIHQFYSNEMENVHSLNGGYDHFLADPFLREPAYDAGSRFREFDDHSFGQGSSVIDIHGSTGHNGYYGPALKQARRHDKNEERHKHDHKEARRHDENGERHKHDHKEANRHDEDGEQHKHDHKEARSHNENGERHKHDHKEARRHDEDGERHKHDHKEARRHDEDGERHKHDHKEARRHDENGERHKHDHKEARRHDEDGERHKHDHKEARRHDEDGERHKHDHKEARRHDEDGERHKHDHKEARHEPDRQREKKGDSSDKTTKNFKSAEDSRKLDNSKLDHAHNDISKDRKEVKNNDKNTNKDINNDKSSDNISTKNDEKEIYKNKQAEKNNINSSSNTEKQHVSKTDIVKNNETQTIILHVNKDEAGKTPLNSYEHLKIDGHLLDTNTRTPGPYFVPETPYLSMKLAVADSSPLMTKSVTSEPAQLLTDLAASTDNAGDLNTQNNLLSLDALSSPLANSDLKQDSSITGAGVTGAISELSNMDFYETPESRSTDSNLLPKLQNSDSQVQIENDGSQEAHGSDTDDFIVGTEGSDVIHAQAGGDVVWGGAGEDVLSGDDGNDRLEGGADNDVINGGQGDDFLSGGLGSDVIDGGDGLDAVDMRDVAGGAKIDLSALKTEDADGSDTLISIENAVGGTGNDEITGNSDDNELNGLEGDDLIKAGDGKDNVHGGSGSDTLQGEDDSDGLFGESGDDVLSGGNGNDVLTGGGGADLLSGGPGKDMFVFDTEDSTASMSDTILDFEDGDLIRLSKPQDAKESHPFSSLKIDHGDDFTSISYDHFYLKLAGEITPTASDFIFSTEAN